MGTRKKLKNRAEHNSFGLHERTRDRDGSLGYVDTRKRPKSRADTLHFGLHEKT